MRPIDIPIPKGKKRMGGYEKLSPGNIDYKGEETKQMYSIKKLLTKGLKTMTSSLLSINKAS
jgi:hypothetical protein